MDSLPVRGRAAGGGGIDKPRIDLEGGGRGRGEEEGQDVELVMKLYTRHG